MLRTLSLTAAFALAMSLAGAAGAQTLDKAGKCRDAKGHYTKMELCKTPPAAAKCRDVKTKKFAKCGTPGTEAVPAKK